MRRLLTRLLLVVSVALVPALGFQVYSESQARHIRKQLVEEEALRLVRLVAAEQQRILEGTEQTLNAISGAPAVQDNWPEICQRLLRNVVEQSPRYTTVAVIGLDGRVVCVPRADQRGIDVSDRDYFRAALQSGGFTLGGYEVSRGTGQPVLHMAKPFRTSDGTVAGVVVAALGIDWLGQQLERLPLPPGASVSIADRNGTILARHPDGARFVGQPMVSENRFSLEGNEVGIARMTSLDGRPIIAAYSPPGADPRGLRIAVGMDREVAFAAVTQADRIGLTLILFGAALALVTTALLGARLIGRPVNRLLAASERWRTGDLAAVTGLPADGSEFGRLGASFDRMASALDARERALRAALESTTDGVIVLDRSWRFTYLNEHAKTLIARGRDLLGKEVWEAFPGLAGTEFGDAYRAAMEHGRPTRAKGYYAPLDGYYEARVYPSNEGVSVFYHDLTEERRIAAALAGTETRLRLAQEAAGIGIWEYDSAANRVIWSPEQFRLHGVDPASDPPTFEQWLEFVDPEDRPAIQQAVAAVEASGGTLLRLEFRIRRKSDGALRWLGAFCRMVTDEPGRPSRLVGVNLDVTDRRQAEDDLRRATALLHAIGTCSPDPIYAKDTEGRFLFANPAVLAIIGKTAAEVIGRTDAEWHDDPMQAAAVMANDRRIIETGCVERLDETFDAAGVGTRVFRSGKAPLRAEDGTVLGVVAVSSDITQIKATEAELRRLTEELELRVSEEVAAREAAQARAAHAERIQALGQLAGGIAHDFNNVLQAVEGAVVLVEREAGENAIIRRLVRVALDAAGRGASITRRLLAFGRRGDLRAEALDVADMLSGLQEVFAHTLGAAIEVHVELGDSLPPILADKGQLETALVNLATNARDAMPEGGRLTLSAGTESVSAGGSQNPAGLAPGRYVRLTVADTGIGMDAATLARVAEPFFTTKKPGNGTGLGLPMAKGFAEQSGGALSVESSPGEGTMVTLWLPEAASDRNAGTTAPEGAEDAAAVVTGNAAMYARLLLVDDEELVREVLAEQLEDAGFSVQVAANGTEALALLSAGAAVDALVTDLSMPGMDGLALVRAVKERCPGLPAVLLTGYSGDGAETAMGGTVTGAFCLLRKPVRAHDLIDRIKILMAGGRTAA